MPFDDVAPLAHLQVRLDDFVRELQRMVKLLGRRNAGDALIGYVEGRLRMRLGGTELQVPAQGRWAGEARIGSTWIRSFAKVPPRQDPLIFQVHEGRLRIANSSAPCHWQRDGEATIEVPMGMELADLIRFAHTHDDEALEKSGVASAVKSARCELDKRITAAAKQLGPLGVTPADLRLLVVGKLQLN